jgi:two-component system, OmpR family, phosphate regulon sensor histidine kinase PhoR
MVFNARFVSLLISSCTALVGALSSFYFNQINIFQVFIIALFTFSACYVTCYLLLEFIVFRELRNMYQNIMTLDEKSSKVINTVQNFNLTKMSNELFNYSEKKNKELKKMKEVESFRRQFLADIAHELKTPVHIAQGFIETLIDGAIDDLTVRDKFLQKTSNSLDNLDLIIRDLINISHLETGEIKLDLQQQDLFSLAKETINQLEEKADNKKIKVVLEINPQHQFFVNIDAYRIKQVFTNLISNAINYAGKEKQVWVRLIEKNKKILVEIEDNGIGIPQEHHTKIFNRFYRVEKSRSKEQGGTGLGLAIVKHILEVHQSEIKISSDLGQGTKFYFELNKV